MNYSQRQPFIAWAFTTVLLGSSTGALSADGIRGEPALDWHKAVTTADREDEFPAIGLDDRERPHVAWVSYDGRRDDVYVSRWEGDAWSARERLSGGEGDCWRPVATRDGQRRLWVIWSQNDGGNWDLRGRYLSDNKWSDPLRLTVGREADMCQQIAVDSQGQLWIAWQSVADGAYEVFLGQVTPQGLRERRNVSRHAASDWEPAIATDKLGRVHVGWDSYRNGNYDIYVCTLDGGVLSEPIAVTNAPEYEAHVSLATDLQDRLWIAWDSAESDWGRHGTSRSRLHAQRAVHLRRLDVEQGTLFAPREEPSAVLTGELASFCELPVIHCDAAGRLWMIVRHLRDLTPSGFRQVGNRRVAHQPRGSWNPYVLCYADGTWTQPVRLPDSNGRNDMRVACCRDFQEGLWIAWSEDGRKETRAEEPINHNVHAARVRLPMNADTDPPVVPTNRKIAEPQAPVPAKPARYELTVGDQKYRLLFGDTHRHTDISRCGMNYDGSLMDTYRYAIDAAELDFLAISDHDQDLMKHRYGRQQQGPLQGYDWWRSQKYCDLFHIEGRFLTIYGYEHGGSYAQRGGHKNVLFLKRGNPCYEEDSPEELFNVLRGTEAVVIPHQLADGGSATDWSRWNSEFERVAEIFQARGSYEFLGGPRQASVSREGHYLRDALGGGVRIGVIASSDHGLVHGAYAGVYAKDMTRAAVLEALRARRTFGATETMVLDLRLGDVMLGGDVETSRPPELRVFARGVEPFESVEVVKDGRIVYSQTPEAAECRFQFVDVDLAPGSSAYYYLRAKQINDEWAWSSAIWVQRQQ